MKSLSGFTASKARNMIAIACIALLVPGQVAANASVYPETRSASPQVSNIPPEQLESLVAPIALYPDPLLAQVLAASTYPLEIVQLQQWLGRHPGLKDKALADAVAQQPWDPSVQAMAGLPDVVNRLANDIQWTADLGNAFLAQQNDVMDAVQRMRQRAMDKGTLKPTEQQTVETKTVENRKVIVIEQANPQVIYVPSYDPLWVWGPPIYYPYPAIYYPAWGYYPYGVAVSFGVGVVMGAFWGGAWGWGCGWGHHHHVYVNTHSHFHNNYYHGGYATPRGYHSGSASYNWQHNPRHRVGTPYADRATATRFGGTARNDSFSSRQAIARQQISRQGGVVTTYRSNGTGTRTNGTRTRSSAPASNYSNRSTADRSAARSYGGSTNGRSAVGSVSGRTYSGGSGSYSGAVRRVQGTGNSSSSRSYLGASPRALSSGSRSVGGFTSRSSGTAGVRSGGSARSFSGGGSRSMASRSGGGGRR
jgi:hypothetical protein